MRHDDSLADNLFGRLFSYTPRPGREPLEDFCTEALAWCLHESDAFRTEFFGLVKNRLGVSLPDLEQLKVETQVGFKRVKDSENEENSDPNSGRFDLVVRSGSSEIILIFENKVNSDFSQTQIPRYRQELDRLLREKEYKRGFLIALTKYAIPAGFESKEKLHLELRWADVHVLLQRASPGRTERRSVRSTIGQFAEFLTSRGMYFMKIPKTQKSQAFKDGIEFCSAIGQILKQVADSFEEIRGGDARLIEYPKNAELWFEIGSYNSVRLGFRMKPTHRLLVGTNCDGKRRAPSRLPFQIEDFNSWEGGFEFYGKFAKEMEGNVDEIRKWFENAVKQALKMR